MIKIDKKIKSWDLVKDKEPSDHIDTAKVQLWERDEVTVGKTYKIKPPQSEHALYVTYNNNLDGKIIEVFFNTKNITITPWLNTLSRMMSAVFRREHDVSFLVAELSAISDAENNWFAKGRFIKSLSHAIGLTLEQHLSTPKADIVEPTVTPSTESEAEDETYPDNAVVCKQCNRKSAVILDGCPTCLASDCQYSKCG